MVPADWRTTQNRDGPPDCQLWVVRLGDRGFAFSTALLLVWHLNISPRNWVWSLSHPPLNLSHPPLSIKSPLPPGKYQCSTRPFWRVATEHYCITSYPYPIPVSMEEIAMIHVLQHSQNRPHLEPGFPPSPSWEAGGCSHPPPMAHRATSTRVGLCCSHRPHSNQVIGAPCTEVEARQSWAEYSSRPTTDSRNQGWAIKDFSVFSEMCSICEQALYGIILMILRTYKSCILVIDQNVQIVV